MEIAVHKASPEMGKKIIILQRSSVLERPAKDLKTGEGGF